MAGTQSPAAPTDADPDIRPEEAPSGAPGSVEAARRLQRIRANLRLPDRPFQAPSAAHDAGLRALGLLDFVRLDLPASGVRGADLVAELVASYSYKGQCSFVRGKKIEVSLDTLSKALCLAGRPVDRPPAGADPAAVASAAQEFIRVYFPPRIRYGDAALVAVKHGRAHAVNWKCCIHWIY